MLLWWFLQSMVRRGKELHRLRKVVIETDGYPNGCASNDRCELIPNELTIAAIIDRLLPDLRNNISREFQRSRIGDLVGRPVA